MTERHDFRLKLCANCERVTYQRACDGSPWYCMDCDLICLDGSEWVAAMVVCAACGYDTWAAVYPVGCVRLECPRCGYMTDAPVAVARGDDA